MFNESVTAVFSQSVTIGPEFFVKSFNDYRDKYLAFAREILQNSLDCGSSRIEIQIVEMLEDKQTLIIVTNDGSYMDRTTLVDKLLSLGSSGKDFQGAVGGFGKAKEILYFAHERYTIHSGQWRVSGSGAGYNLERRDHCFLGTRSAVTWKGHVGDALRAKFRRFIELCGRRGCEFTLDGEAVKPTLTRFRCDRPLVHEGEVWAQLGDVKFEENLIVVRIGGLPMFVERSAYKRTLVLELQGDSGKRLTANRDSLKYPHSTQLSELLTQLTVDRRSALTLEEPIYVRFAGPKLQGVAEPRYTTTDEPGSAAPYRPSPGGGIRSESQGRTEAPVSVLPYEFILKNCVRRDVPREFDPADVKFSDHATWLANAWSGCLRELYTLFEIEGEFAVGFVLSEDAEAQHEKSAEYGRVYYINPCVVGRKSIKRRWTKANWGRLAAIAGHEFVHGAFNESYHGEDFANWQTEVTGRMLNNPRRIARHFA